MKFTKFSDNKQLFEIMSPGLMKKRVDNGRIFSSTLMFNKNKNITLKYSMGGSIHDTIFFEQGNDKIEIFF